MAKLPYGFWDKQREGQVRQWLAADLTLADIAERLGITEAQVKAAVKTRYLRYDWSRTDRQGALGGRADHG